MNLKFHYDKLAKQEYPLKQILSYSYSLSWVDIFCVFSFLFFSYFFYSGNNDSLYFLFGTFLATNRRADKENPQRKWKLLRELLLSRMRASRQFLAHPSKWPSLILGPEPQSRHSESDEWWSHRAKEEKLALSAKFWECSGCLGSEKWRENEVWASAWLSGLRVGDRTWTFLWTINTSKTPKSKACCEENWERRRWGNYDRPPGWIF